MFGSIGGPEILLIFVLGLLLFGPRKLPEIGRTLGKTLAEFRRATSEFTASLEREVALEKRKEDEPNLAARLLAPAPGPVARDGRPTDVSAPVTPPVPPISEPVTPHDV